MHSPDSEGTRDPQERTDRTVQGTLDMFLAEVPEAPHGAGPRRTPPAEAVARAGTEAAASTAVRAAHGEQRSIDTFEPGDVAARQELEARSPRAAAGLMLERDVERVARREAANGISRDELVIVIAREVQLPLEDLQLVDSYVSDLILEGKLRLVGERVLLTPEARIASAVRPVPPAPPIPLKRQARPTSRARQGGRSSKRRQSARGKAKARRGKDRAAPPTARRRRRAKGGGRG